jgi:hypothetical protein
MGEHQPLTAERLFERYFWPLYPEDAQRDLSRARTEDANPAGNLAILASLDEVAHTFAVMSAKAFATNLALDGSDESVHRLSAAIDRKTRDRWAGERAPDGASLLAQVVVHGAVYVGACVLRNHQASWRVRRPLWESMVRLASPRGPTDLAVFHWWLKSLSDAEIDRHTLADRYRAHVEEPTLEPDGIVPILAEPRPIPRLTVVRYHTLHKHLRAHLPELRDLGEHFVSSDRLSELGLRRLDFFWLGGARMLLLHGPGANGVHLFWLDRGGFVKAAFYAADAESEYELSSEGDMLRIVMTAQGRTAEHVMLWWGP